MKQLLLPEALAAGQRVELAGDEYHYLVRVLRKTPGDRFPAIDALGARWSMEVEHDDGSRLVLVAHEPEPAAGSASGFPRVTLYQAIPKGNKLDDEVRKLVQFGVSRICPIITDRTISRPDPGSARLDRWRRIAREAVQQSGADQPTEILDPQSLDDVQPDDDALSLVLHQEPLAQASLHGYLGSIPEAVELVVGPEGGFADSELSTLLDSGFAPLWLGPQVLRSESAALFAAAALRLLIVEHAQWQPAHE